jgi:hypothetical protein
MIKKYWSPRPLFVFLGSSFLAATLANGQSIRPSETPVPSVGGEAAAAAQGARGTASISGAQATPRNGLAAAAVSASQVKKVFEGFRFDDNAGENDGFRFIPPDPIGAAGNSRLIAVVNSMIESRNKGGALKWRTGLADFFAPLAPGDYPFDPKIVYDQYEDRFAVVALELIVGTASTDPANVSRILLAVSKSGNPQTSSPADWNFHAINAKTVIGPFELWADYPGFEVDEEAIYVTANIFTFVPFGFFGGSRLWIVDKGAGSGGFYDGGPADASAALDPYASPGSVATTTMPAQVFGPGGAGPGIGTFLVSYSGLTDGADEYIQVVRVDDPVGTPAFTQEFVNIGSIETLPPFTALPDAPQAGTTALIEVNDRRALDAVWRNGSLWLTTTINPESGPDAGQTTAHWVELDTSAAPAGPIALTDQGDLGGEDIAPGTFTYFPAVAVNRDGEARFGFSASAPTIFAGAFVAGVLGPTQTVKAGEDYYIRTFGGPRNRWGDYSGIALDPTNEKSFWVFNEFADQRGSPTAGPSGPEDGRWGTAWGRTD